MTDFTEVREWLKDLRDSPEHKEMLDLAVLVREISSRGEAEREMCREILEAIVKYSEAEIGNKFFKLLTVHSP